MTAETATAPRILVVDDVAANVRLLEAIASRPASRSAPRRRARRRSSASRTELPDLVLLDVQMAGMNGYEGLPPIRENEETGARARRDGDLARRRGAH
jgi:two-component system cell cycle response regulator